jgi:beta-phosphoglucomutase
VLIDTMPLHAKAWQTALASHGLRAAKRAIYEWEGEAGIVTARTLLSQRGARPSDGEVSALLAAKERCFRKFARRVRMIPALVRLVQRLDRKGVRLALVTGTSSGEVRRIVPIAVRRRFSVIVTGDRVRRGKPHPEPYATAMRTLGVRPRATVVVENAPYGIRSARRAGAGFVIALASSLPRRFLHEAHLVVPSVPKLVKVLERQFGSDGNGLSQ